MLKQHVYPLQREEFMPANVGLTKEVRLRTDSDEAIIRREDS